MSKNKSSKKIQGRITIRDRGSPGFLSLPHKLSPPPRSGLFRFVYGSSTTFLLTLLLISSFALQGIYVVEASEPVPETLDIITPADISVDDVEEEFQDEVAVQVKEAANEEGFATNVSDSETLLSEITDTPMTQSEELADDINSELEEGVDSADKLIEPDTQTSTEVVLEEGESEFLDLEDQTNTATTTPIAEEDSADGGEVEETSDADQGAGDSESDSSADALPGADIGASTTIPLGDTSDEDGVDETTEEAEEEVPDPIGPALTEALSTNYNDSGFMFSKGQCTKLASGSYYCHEPNPNILEDALFSAPDKDGDTEIFLVRDGLQTQITNNLVDDSAPFYDQNSETIVWHRLINERYQIVSYNVESGVEEQITSDSTNNMEPVRQGKYIVWQRWVKNSWEVILYDGKSEVQISRHQAHDIAPYIHGSLVVWNKLGDAGEKTIEMYDIRSETYVSVNDSTGLSVSNPRMVFIYDQLHPNGDIVTKGYDMLSRSFIQLDTLPRSLPEQIPQSEPTNETRALIQSKPAVKGDGLVPVDITPDDNPPDVEDISLLPGVSASSSDLTLDMTNPAATTSLPVVFNPSEIEISEFDLVIEPMVAPVVSEGSVQETSAS